MARLSRPGWLG